MNRDEKLLVAVFDGEHARFIWPSKTTGLHTARNITAAEAHKRSSDLRSDRPGASFHSESTTRHAFAPRHDPHELAKEEFARFVAAELNGMAEEAFDRLVLTAPPHILTIAIETLRPAVSAKLIGTVPKDLVKIPDDGLWEHVKAFVPPVSRPSGGR